MTVAEKYLKHLHEIEEAGWMQGKGVGQVRGSSQIHAQAAQARQNVIHLPVRSIPHVHSTPETPPEAVGVRGPSHTFGNIRATLHRPITGASANSTHKNASASSMPSAPSPNQQRHSTLWNRDLSQDPEHTTHIPNQNISFNDFKNIPKSPPSSHQPTPSPHPHPGVEPTYDYSRQFQTVNKIVAAPAVAVAAGIGFAGRMAQAGGRRFIVSPWQRRAELRRNLKATAKSVSGRLGPPPKRILKDIVQLKKQYPEYAADIDREIKAHNVHLQDWDYGHQQAFKTQAKTIAKRYHDVGKVMARQQGRHAAWRILKSVPGVARQEYNRIKSKGEIEARNIRDQELQARAGNIQQHAREVDYHYDQHMDQVTRDLEKGVLQAKAHGHAEQQAAIQAQAQAYAQSQAVRASHESLLFIEGKARDFREVMRNKRKTHARHVRAIDRGTMRYSYDLKKRGRKSKERNPYDSPSWWGKDIGRETTLDQRKSRKRSALRKKMKTAAYAAYSPYEPDGPYGMREEYAGKHPVLHTTGKTLALPVTVPYHVARGVAKFTGLDELPIALKDMHARNKRGFVHNFLLR